MAAALPLLVIVTGPPASGKTFVGRKIADRFKLPYFYKDGFKELLFDRLGWQDAAWSRRLNQASLELLYYQSESLLAAGCSHLLESNFKAESDTARLLALKAKYPFEPFQVNCVADGPVLLERFKSRQRHPGHADDEILDYLTPVLLKGRMAPLEIGGRLVEVDTTGFEKIPFDEIFSALSNYIPRL